jgi:hypothetical protein
LVALLYQAQQRGYEHRHKLGRAALENVHQMFNSANPALKLGTDANARAQYAQAVVGPSIKFIYARPEQKVRNYFTFIYLT